MSLIEFDQACDSASSDVVFDFVECEDDESHGDQPRSVKAPRHRRPKELVTVAKFLAVGQNHSEATIVTDLFARQPDLQPHYDEGPFGIIAVVFYVWYVTHRDGVETVSSISASWKRNWDKRHHRNGILGHVQYTIQHIYPLDGGTYELSSEMLAKVPASIGSWYLELSTRTFGGIPLLQLLTRHTRAPPNHCFCV
jgi:hypothetical protein